MALRAARSQLHSPLRPEFAAFLSMLLGAGIVAGIAMVFVTQPQLRTTSAWMPYDTAQELRISGVVEDVQSTHCLWCGSGSGVHLLLRTTEGLVEIHLADARFLRAHGYALKKGDRVEVLGAKLAHDGGKSLVAREVTHGNRRIILRDSGGRPAWLME